MKLGGQLKGVSSEVLRMWALGRFFPSQIRHQIACEEMEQKLRAVCGEHYDVAVAWIEWRRDWTMRDRWGVDRRVWLGAAADELDHAMRYGPHTESPHVDKLSASARDEVLRRVGRSSIDTSDQGQVT